MDSPYDLAEFKADWSNEAFEKENTEASDPGYLYMFRFMDRYKIGRTTDPRSRINTARTWIPDLEIIGIKPFWNVREKEILLHIGLATFWWKGEWFTEFDEGIIDTVVQDFIAFSDTDIDGNSVNFIYWYNGSGMVEFAIEQEQQGLNNKKFLSQESFIKETK